MRDDEREAVKPSRLRHGGVVDERKDDDQRERGLKKSHRENMVIGGKRPDTKVEREFRWNVE